ncbi:BUR1 [Malassezia furfur]|nr:BUR1 [Malassezia furfur]
MDDYEITVKLGQGTFGEVKKGKQVATGRDVALKKVTIHEVKDGMPITALREIKLLKTLHHPYIVPVIDMVYRAATERGKMGEVFMVEPYMDHDLNGLLDNPTIQLQMNQIKLYMRELLEGTLYMHQNNILHRDMKAANLLIDNNGQLQIADFGLARPYYDPGQAWRARGWKGGVVNYTDMVVTRWYRPPELLAGQRNYGPPVDMWGIGCILAEMVTGKPLFKGASEINQLELIASLCGSPNDDNFPGWSKLPGVKNATPSGRPDTNPNVQGRHDFGRHPRVVRQHFTTVVDVGRECADLIDRLLTLDPCKRITAAEALEHEWFWTKPYPADPASLPKYVPSKEIDRAKRDHQHKMAGRVHMANMPVPMGVAPPPPIVAPPMAIPPPQQPPAPGAGAGAGAYPPMPRLPLAAGLARTAARAKRTRGGTTPRRVRRAVRGGRQCRRGPTERETYTRR